ncbi:MAG: ATP synthase subunit I [Butyricicoccaceae bacterium]
MISGGDSIKVSQDVKHETKQIALGVGILTVLMLVVIGILKATGTVEVDMLPVLLGAIVGAAYAIGNFFALGLAVQKAVATGDQAEAQKIIQLSYMKRMLVMVIVLIVAFKLPYFFWVTTVLPLIFPRITIFVKTLPIFNRKGEE